MLSYAIYNLYHVKHYDRESKYPIRSYRESRAPTGVAVSGLFRRIPKFTREWLRRRQGLVSADAVPALWEKGMLVPRVVDD